MNDFDQFLKHTLKLRFVRYMDDVVMLGTKDSLKQARKEISHFFLQERLILHPYKEHFHPVSQSVSFVGYKIKNGNIYVGKRAKKSLLRFVDTYGVSSDDFGEDIKLSSCLASRVGAFTHSVNTGTNYLKNLGLEM
jgi:hypothetical protein